MKKGMKNLALGFLLLFPVTCIGGETLVTLSGGEQIRIVHEGMIRAIRLTGGQSTITSIENLRDRATEKPAQTQGTTSQKKRTHAKQASEKTPDTASANSAFRMSWAKPKIED